MLMPCGSVFVYFHAPLTRPQRDSLLCLNGVKKLWEWKEFSRFLTKASVLCSRSCRQTTWPVLVTANLPLNVHNKVSFPACRASEWCVRHQLLSKKKYKLLSLTERGS